MIKKISLGLATAFVVIFSVALVVSAVEIVPGGSRISDTDSLVGTISSIVNIFFTILLAIATVMILWAAYNYVTAAGDENKIKTAKTTLLYALLGIAIAVISRGVVTLIKSTVSSQIGG
ncbi:MAG: hypothetical protein QMD86_02670 [Patescibacteria group bacterium]|nr:hypothetical protein [Patescibacteria group bacterium]